MLYGTPIWKIIVDAYILWIFVYFFLKYLLTNKRMVAIAMVVLFIFLVTHIAEMLNLLISTPFLVYIRNWLPIAVVLIMAPDIRRSIELIWKAEDSKRGFVMGSEKTKESIIDAALHLAMDKTGALITIEKYNTLDQYAERAVMMNSQVSKELLINIFTPKTPLHDGAVIIRGDHILCAGAYFILSESENFDRTMGSRHRAGLGISEITDSMTIVVSEETGNISVAIEGILLRINDREKLMEYINMFMK
jgi:diadenylate cyclase